MPGFLILPATYIAVNIGYLSLPVMPRHVHKVVLHQLYSILKRNNILGLLNDLNCDKSLFEQYQYYTTRRQEARDTQTRVSSQVQGYGPRARCSPQKIFSWHAKPIIVCI